MGSKQTMIETLVRLGDLVQIHIDKDTRNCTSEKLPANGTTAIVRGWHVATTYYGRTRDFGVRPGKYEVNSDVRLELPNQEGIYLGANRLVLVDQEEYERRRAELYKVRDPRGGYLTSWPRLWMEELPGTEFWEDDIVRLLPGSYDYAESQNYQPWHDGSDSRVHRISYSNVADKGTRDDGSPYPFYTVQSVNSDSCTMAWCEHELELVERGRVWKYYNKEPLAFVDLADEAKFFQELGHYDEVRNPVTGNYAWTYEAVCDAIANNLVDCFNTPPGLFGGSQRISALRFHDRDLGKRLRQESLIGHNLEDIVND